MHIHILGICGTFMGSLAQLAKAKGHRVTGSDLNVYPPMSTQLEAAGIELMEGFALEQIDLKPDVFVIGNVVSRGNPLMEEILDRGLPYVSGPQWLSEHILKDKWVLGVAGTHGKTTTSSMLAWILEYAAMAPGYLIGGVPGNFPCSARLGESDFFVIEADEYDTAFFDKRSKFIHYHPRTLIINNLEFDHADIFADLNAIKTQFHHLVRTMPRNALIVHQADEEIDDLLERGCWTPCQSIGDKVWNYDIVSDDMGTFNVSFNGEHAGQVQWNLGGQHNIQNALAAIAAARHVGVISEMACEALSQFQGVKRRMELVGEVNGAKVYDDFAHHPTAIASTIAGLRAKVGEEPIIVVLEPRSNTMKQGVHKSLLLESVAQADQALWFQDAKMSWSLSEFVEYDGAVSKEGRLGHSEVCDCTDSIIQKVCASVEKQAGQSCHILIMSNGGFENIHARLVRALEASSKEN